MRRLWLLLCILASPAAIDAHVVGAHVVGAHAVDAHVINAHVINVHVNDRGMDYRAYKDRYGQSCCHIQDCRPASDFVEAIENGEPVIRLLIDGTWITVARSYVVAALASDGRAHFCGKLYRPSGSAGEVKPEPICVILPPRAT